MSNRALVVGINSYSGRPEWELRGCVNDSRAMVSLLTDQYGFDSDEVLLLEDGAATRAAIRDGLGWLLDGYRGDGSDRRLFFVASHGTQVAASGDDGEPDSLDELIVPTDHSWDDPLVDNELRARFAAIPPDVSFTFIADCCHSGSIHRDDEPGTDGREVRTRYVEPPPPMLAAIDRIVHSQEAEERAWVEQELARYRDDRPLAERLQGRRDLREKLKRIFWRTRRQQALPTQGQVLLAACRDDQTAADAYIDGAYRGAFTWSLITALRAAKGVLTYADLIAESRQLLVDYSQEPQLDADEDWRNRPFLAPNPSLPGYASR